MLRWLVLVLLLANAGYLAWSQHWLAGLGLAPASDSEPAYLRRQITPEALRVLPGPAGTNPGTAGSTGAEAQGAAASTTAGAEAAGAAAVTTAAGPVAGPNAGTAPEDSADTAAAAPDGTAAGAASAAPAEDGAGSAAAANAGVVTVSAAGAAAPASATTAPAAAERGECLQAGPFDSAEASAWRRAASVLPQGSWSLERRTTPGRWMVYLGRFSDSDALAKKRSDLRARGISYDRPGVASLEPGLSLGRFSTEEAADRALATLVRKNGDALRNARVVVERAETVSFQLRLPLVTAALRAQLNTLRPALAGNALSPCF